MHWRVAASITLSLAYALFGGLIGIIWLLAPVSCPATSRACMAISCCSVSLP